MAEPVTIRDLGIGELRRKLAEMKGRKVTIGHQGPSGAERHPGDVAGDTTVAEVSAMMEFGTVTAPARPAVRTTLDRFAAPIREQIRAAVSDVIDGRASIDKAQERVGEFMLDRLRETILDAKRWAPPLAAATIAAKGHDLPLIDTDTYYDRASWAVRKGDVIVLQGGEQ